MLDTHTATVRWGDGSQSAATVAETGGAGTASASHSYGSEGDYDVEVCVTDDDGETGCDGFTVTWRIPVLDVGIGQDRQPRDRCSRGRRCSSPWWWRTAGRSPRPGWW